LFPTNFLDFPLFSIIISALPRVFLHHHTSLNLDYNRHRWVSLPKKVMVTWSPLLTKLKIETVTTLSLPALKKF
jgi:hypothetical protein